MGLRVLLVDDDVNFLHAASEFMKNKGYDVATAEDAPEALGYLRELVKDKKSVDAIVTDLIMPGDGTYFIEDLPGIFVEAKPTIIVYTAMNDDMHRDICKKLGADEYIVKPGLEELCSSLEKLQAERDDPTKTILEFRDLLKNQKHLRDRGIRIERGLRKRINKDVWGLIDSFQDNGSVLAENNLKEWFKYNKRHSLGLESAEKRYLGILNRKTY